MTEGTPNNTNSFIFTRFIAKLRIEPMEDETAIANSEYVVAIFGSTPSASTNTGTVSIDPPLPTKPRVIPIKSAKTSPKISIYTQSYWNLLTKKEKLYE